MTDTDAARAAFHQGAYNEARTLLGTRRTGEDGRLLLTIALRERDWDRALAEARQIQVFGDDYARLGRVYAAYIHRAITGKPVDAALERAENPELDAEIVRVHASLAWMDGRHNEARKFLSSTSPATPTQRVQYIELRAWCATSHGARAPILLNALTLAIDNEVDVGLISHIAHPVAVLARETDLGALTERARELLKSIEWGALENDDRFYAERALAWLDAQNGEYVDALYRLDQLLPRAANPQQCALAATDRARVCRLAEDPVNEAVAARHALDAFESIAWDAPHNDVPLAVYGSIDVLAREDPQRTRDLVALADDAMLTPAMGAHLSPVTDAYRKLAHATIADDNDAGLDLARAAYRIFKEAGYNFRAALAALCAYDCSHIPHWRDKVATYVSRYDRSPLARDLAWRSEPLQRITPRRRAILERVAAFETNRQIATGLGLSENTVKEHIRILHRIFNVSRRSELAAVWTRARIAA